jgi:hypothetical protein
LLRTKFAEPLKDLFKQVGRVAMSMGMRAQCGWWKPHHGSFRALWCGSNSRRREKLSKLRGKHKLALLAVRGFLTHLLGKDELHELQLTLWFA